LRAFTILEAQHKGRFSGGSIIFYNAARKVTTVEANFHIYLGFGRNGKDIRKEKEKKKT